MEQFQNLLYWFLDIIPSVITAVLLLIIAFVAASLAKYLVIKALKVLKLDRYIDKIGIEDETTGSSLVFIGKLIYLIVFLLFLPSVLDKLGMQNVAAPITNMVTRFLDFIPNILAAVIILVIGLFVAKIIRQIITSLLKKLKVDRLQEKAGIEAIGEATISSAIAYIIYVIIVIPIVIAALQILNIEAISQPAVSMLDTILIFLPNIFVAIAIIIIGIFIARIVGKLIETILLGVGTDMIMKKINISENTKINDFSLSKTTGKVVKYIIILLSTVEAFNVINLTVLQSVGETIIAYLPFVASALIIMGGSVLLAIWVEGIIMKKFENSKFTAFIVKLVIITIAVFMTLSQLGIAISIVNSAFVIVLGSLAIAFAIAFGIGGRDFASNILRKFEEKIDSSKDN